MSVYLNVGCGKMRYSGVTNVDVVNNEFTDVDVVADMAHLPYKDETVDGIIAHHVLEHVPKEAWKPTVMEWRRVLKPAGKLLVAVPNLEKVLHYYLTNHKGLRDYWYTNIYGRNRYLSDRHLSGFTNQTLTELLFDCGFVGLQWQEQPPSEEHNLKVIATKGDLPTTLQEVKRWHMTL